MFTADGQLVGLIDFEELCTGPRLLDLATTLAGCCYTMDAPALTAVVRPALARALVAGYERVAGPLPADERVELGAYMELAALILVFWRYRQFNVRLAATSTAADRRRYREMVALLTAVVRAEGRPLVAGHLALLQSSDRPANLGDAPPESIASLLWP